MKEIYSNCRYGDIVKSLFGDWKLIADKSVQDYQGEVYCLFEKDHQYALVEFNYGSCSGCDEWEDRELNDDQIKDEIQKLTMYMTHEEFYDLKRRASLVKELVSE